MNLKDPKQLIRFFSTPSGRLVGFVLLVLLALVLARGCRRSAGPNSTMVKAHTSAPPCTDSRKSNGQIRCLCQENVLNPGSAGKAEDKDAFRKKKTGPSANQALTLLIAVRRLVAAFILGDLSPSAA
jgi:hypothetical protein